MANNTRKAAIPPVPTDVPKSLLPFLRAVREQIQVQGGHGRGSELDRALTLRDLKQGVLSVEINRLATRSAEEVVGGLPIEVDPPTVPTGVQLFTNATQVIARWDQPSFKGYWYTQVYRTTWDGVTPPAFNDNFAYDQTTGAFLDGVVNSDQDYVYWFRHVNIEGELSALSAPGGHAVKTGVPINLQEGWIGAEQLKEDLEARINLIDAPDIGLVDKLTAIEGDYITATKLSNELSSYVSTSGLSSTLTDYVTSLGLSQTLTDYVTELSLDTTLGSYVTSTALEEEGFAKTTDLVSYATTGDLGAVSTRVGTLEIASADQATRVSLLEYNNFVDEPPRFANMGILSPRVALAAFGTLYFMAIEDGTELYQNGELIFTLNKGESGTIGSAGFSAGDIFETNGKPLPIVNITGGAQLAALCMAGTFFGHECRDSAVPSNADIYVYAPYIDAEVRITDENFDPINLVGIGTNVAVCPAGQVTKLTAVRSILAQDHIGISSTAPVVTMVAKSSWGDTTVGTPGSRKMLMPRNVGAVIPSKAGQTITRVTGGAASVYWTSDAPFGVGAVGDAAGGDAEVGIAQSALGDVYAIPHDVRGYSVAAVEPTVITVSDSLGNVFETIDLSAASEENPLHHNTGSVSGANSDPVLIPSGAILTGTGRFALRTNINEDEYVVFGYYSRDRAAYVDGSPLADAVRSRVTTIETATADHATRLGTLETASTDYTARIGTLETATSNYALKSELTSYVTTTDLGTTLGSYVTSTDLTNAGYAKSSDLTAYVTSDSLTGTLSSYVTSTSLANADYATNSTVTEYVEALVLEGKALEAAPDNNYTFSTDGVNEGWNAQGYATATVANGIYSFSVTTQTDPRIQKSIPAASRFLGRDYPFVVCRIRRTSDNPINLSGQFIWQDAATSTFRFYNLNDEVARINALPKGEWTEVIIDMTGVQYWDGETISLLRFDWGQNPDSGYSYDIDYIMVARDIGRLDASRVKTLETASSDYAGRLTTLETYFDDGNGTSRVETLEEASSDYAQRLSTVEYYTSGATIVYVKDLRSAPDSWPTSTTYDSTTNPPDKWTFTPNTADQGKAGYLHVYLSDAETGARVAFNGVELGSCSAPDNAIRWFTFPITTAAGVNEVAVWSSNSDGGSTRGIVVTVGGAGEPMALLEGNTSAARVSTLEAATSGYALKSDLTSYVTTTDLGTTLGSYVTSTALADADYATNTTLTNYTTTANLPAAIKGQFGGAGVNLMPPQYARFLSDSLPPMRVNAAAGTATFDATESYLGGGSLKLAATANDLYAAFTTNWGVFNFPVEEGKNYILSGYVKCNLASKTAQLSTGFTQKGFSTSATPNTWTRISAVVTVPAGVSATYFRVDNDGGNGCTMWFDGLMIEEQVGSATTPSTFSMPPVDGPTYQTLSTVDSRVYSLEQATADYALASTLTEYTKTTDLPASIKGQFGGSGVNLMTAKYALGTADAVADMSASSGTLSHNAGTSWFGKGSAQFVANDETAFFRYGTSNTVYPMAINKGTKYIVSAYVRASVAGAIGHFALFKANGSQFNSGTFTVSAANTWQRVSGVVYVSGDTTGMRLNFYCKTVGGATYWVDGVMIEEQVGTDTTPSTFALPGAHDVNDIGGISAYETVSSVNTKVATLESADADLATRVVQVSRASGAAITLTKADDFFFSTTNTVPQGEYKAGGKSSDLYDADGVAEINRVGQTDSFRLYYRHAIPVDPTRTYRYRLDVERLAYRGDGSTTVNGGVALLDAGFENVGGGNAVYRYIGHNGSFTLGDGRKVFEGIITGTGTGTNQFADGTRYVRPVFHGNGGHIRIYSLKFEDITDLTAVETRVKASEDEAEYMLKVQYGNGTPAGMVVNASDDGTSILFSGDQFGISNPGVGDGKVLPFSVRDGVVWMQDVVVEKIQAGFITNDELAGGGGGTATLGDTAIGGQFTLGIPGQIQWKDLDPSFRDTLVKIDPNASTTGGTRSAYFSSFSVSNTYYAAVSTGVGENALLGSGGASTTMSFSVSGGCAKANGRVEVHGQHTTPSAPKIVATLYRRINGGAAENMGSGTLTGSIGAEVYYTGPTRYIRQWSSINDTFQFNCPLPTAGQDYEYWIQVTEKSGWWGPSNTMSDTSGGTLTVSVQETIGSSGGVLVETLAYNGTQYFSANDGGVGSGVSVLTGDFFVNNFQTKIADSSGNLYSPGTLYLSNNGAIANMQVGDDVWLGDGNKANTLFVKGKQNNDRGYLIFGNVATYPQLGAIAGGDLTYGGNKIWHEGNDGAGSTLDADTLDGIQASGFTRLNTTSPTFGYTYMRRNDASNAVVYANQRGTGDIARFFVGGSDTATTGTSQVTIDNGANVITTGSFYEGGTALAAKYAAVSHDHTTMNGKHANYYANTAEASTLDTDPDTATAPVILTRHANAPTPGSYYAYVQTLHWNAPDSNGNRAQIAFQYSGTTHEIYSRHIYTGEGGWTPWVKLWHSGNDGSGSGLDADVLRGYAPTTANTGSTIALRDSSGDVTARLMRSTYADQSTISGAIAYRVNTSDNYTRFCNSPSAVRGWLGLSGATTVSTSGPSGGADGDLWFQVGGSSGFISGTGGTVSGGRLTVVNDAGLQAEGQSTINALEILQGTAGADAMITFHVGGDYAAHFGLDGGTNRFSIMGYSGGATKRDLVCFDQGGTYAALRYSDGSDPGWIRTGANGLISNSAGTGSLGTTSWRWSVVYANNGYFTNDWEITSDARVKENLRDIDPAEAAEKLNTLGAAQRYDRIDTGNKDELGTIAQWCIAAGMGDVVNYDEEIEQYSVKYRGLQMYQLSARLDDVRRIKELEEKVARLERLLEAA